MSYEIGTKVRLFTGDEGTITEVNVDSETNEAVSYTVTTDNDGDEFDSVFDDEFEVIEED